MMRLGRNQSPLSRRLYDENDDDNLFAVMAAVGCPFMAAFLVLLRWTQKRLLDQFLSFQRDGKRVHGTKMFTGKTRRRDNDSSGLLHEVIFRYRVELDPDNNLIEITKTEYTAEESSEAGKVEAVELFVLPGYPKSGIECRRAEEESEQLGRMLRCYPWGIALFMIAAIPSWVYFPRVAGRNEWFTVKLTMPLFSSVLAIYALMAKWVVKRHLKRMVDPTDNVTVRELSHNHRDPDLQPLHMLFTYTQDGQNPELRPLFAVPS